MTTPNEEGPKPGELWAKIGGVWKKLGELQGPVHINCRCEGAEAAAWPCSSAELTQRLTQAFGET